MGTMAANTGNPDEYNLDEQIGFILRLAQQRHAALFVDCFENDVTPTQWALIAKLHEVGESSQNHLGRMTAMDVATIQGVVDRLKKRKIVVSRPDDNDKRRVVLSLSDDGKALYRQHLEHAHKVSEQTLAPLDGEERTQLLSLLKKLT